MEGLKSRISNEIRRIIQDRLTNFWNDTKLQHDYIIKVDKDYVRIIIDQWILFVVYIRLM